MSTSYNILDLNTVTFVLWMKLKCTQFNIVFYFLVLYQYVFMLLFLCYLHFMQIKRGIYIVL